MSAREPEYVTATLDWCNEIRMTEGKEKLEALPKGMRNDPLSCPCGRAIDAQVFCDGVWPIGEPAWRTRSIYPVPNLVRLFIEQFDEGSLPQYDELAGA